MNGSMALQVCLVDSSLTRAQRLAAQISRLEFRLSPDVRATGAASGLLGRRQFSTVTFTTEVVSRLETVERGEDVEPATTMVVWYGDRPNIDRLLAKTHGQPVRPDCVVMFDYPESPDCARSEKASGGGASEGHR